VPEPEFGAISGFGPPDEDEDEVEDVVVRTCPEAVAVGGGGLDEETVRTARTAVVGADERTVVEPAWRAVACTTLVFVGGALAATFRCCWRRDVLADAVSLLADAVSLPAGA
jgi:hypothetical protein